MKSALLLLALPLSWGWPLAGTAGGQLACGQRGRTERVSVSSAGIESNGPSRRASISSDGRYVVFDSFASNLVPGDTNGIFDVFLHDRQSGSTMRMNLRADGGEGYFGGLHSSVSDVGPSVCFDTPDDLLPNDTNGAVDVYVRNASTNELRLVSVSSAGALGNSWSYPGVIAAGGRYVAFRSLASNLVPGDTNDYQDVFVHDLVNRGTERVSVSSSGVQANMGAGDASISADGRFVTFASISTNVVTGDTNGVTDYFIHDRSTRQTERISLGSGGVQSNGPSHSGVISSPGADVSANGRFVVFQSDASNIVPNDTNGWRDVFLRDRWEDVTSLVSVNLWGTPGNGHSNAPSITPDGRYVVFSSSASDLVQGDTNGNTDIFVRDLWREITYRVSLASNGAQAFGGRDASISADGLHISFASSGDDLASGDTNGVFDVFVRTEPPPPPTAYCTAQANSLGCTPAIFSNGSPSASAGSGFWINAMNVLNQRSGLLFYGSGSAAIAFQGAVLCVAPPLRRTAVQSSGGNPPPVDCSGSFAFDFNAHVASGVDPALVAGRRIDAQYWSRDPQAASGTNLTDALEFWLCP